MSTLLAALAALSLAAAPPTPTPATTRANVPDKYKWKLSDLYPSDAAWTEARAAFPQKLAAFARHQGHVGDSAKALADTLSDMGSLENELEKIDVYAAGRSDEDTREPKPRAMRAEAEQLAVRAATAFAWVRPAILELPAAQIRRSIGEDARLRDWTFYLEDVIRWKAHTLTPAEEELAARAGDLAGTGRDVHSVLVNADLPFPTVKLSTGEAIRLDQPGYERGRTATSPADREKVFHGFFGALKGYERTLGAALYGAVKARLFDAEAHKFSSSLEAALFQDAIPLAVYTQLVKDVNANLGTLHRYLALRQRLLGLAKLRYEDLYTPLVKSVDQRFSIEQGIGMTLDAVAPLGTGYQAKLKHGLETGWTDFLPSTGKAAGAYSTGVYGVHPFQLLNFNGQWIDVSTLAHEAGHSMHTLLASEKQPFPTASYAIFVAEVASTLNENMLFRHAYARAKDDATRLALLGQRLESLRTTLFRQTMFAEFELAIHERVQKGEALTGEKMSELYLDLVRRYYGHAKGTCEVAELYGDEWSFISHFYNPFYVYQYATSVIASTALAKAIREDEAKGGTAARERYLAMLASGGSKYPVELLREAGVDMTTSAPFTAAMEDMNAVMDEIEKVSRQSGPAAGAARPPAPRK